MNPVWHFLNGVPTIGAVVITNLTTTSIATDSITLGGDVVASRGAANRLDLASGDSLNLVSGNVTATDFFASGSFRATGASRLFLTTADGQAAITNSGVTAGVGLDFSTDGVLCFKTRAQTAAASIALNSPAAATSAHRLIKKITAMGDGSAVDVFTVTVPNAGQSAGVKVTLVSANGSTDAFESTRVAEGFVAIARTSGVATVPTVATLDLAQIATVGSGATHTLAYGVSAVSGLASATQTFTITVTVNDSGNVGGNQVVAIAELINSEATGVTIA